MTTSDAIAQAAHLSDADQHARLYHYRSQYPASRLRGSARAAFEIGQDEIGRQVLYRVARADRRPSTEQTLELVRRALSMDERSGVRVAAAWDAIAQYDAGRWLR